VRRFWLLTLSTIAGALALAPPASADRVFTVDGAAAPGPARFDRVRVIEQGPRKAKNVLVLVPGTSGGAAYFRPVARDIVAGLPGWKTWSVDRRENLLEDHSVLGPVVARERPAGDAFRYYLESITDSSITPRFTPVTDASYAREWGMSVAVRDLRNVIKEARRGGRNVVLAGHSLGATIAIAYATWDFGGRAGANDLAGLVLIDGGSGGAPIGRSEAREELQLLGGESPFLDLSGFGLPWAIGVLNAVGSTLAVQEPDGPAVLAAWPFLPANLRLPVAGTNAAGYGYAIDNDTSPANLALVHMHIGGLAAAGDPRGWADGELGTVARAAEMFSGIEEIDGTAWYHPRRLSLDGQAVAGGVRNRAQGLLGVRAIHGDDLELPIYAIETSLGAGRVLKGARALARRSHVKATLVDRHATYDHLDPLSAVRDKNAFVKTVIPFLRRTR
jgi:pimeloyl-ACP methyl ester carboxylesterase